MRTLITLTMLALISLKTYALSMAASNLIISSADNSFISVAINNSAPVAPSTQINFTNLMPGNHRVKIFRHFMNPGGHWKSKMVYNGFINVPPASEVVYSINFYNQLMLIASNPIWGWNPPPPPPPPAPVFGMAPQTFNQLIISISSTPFDNTRLNIAKQAIMSNGATSQQILELMGMLTFESNRLDLAKFAYRYAADPNNYFMVNNGFTFNSSINELNRFIGF
jgi:hypothetical protein